MTLLARKYNFASLSGKPIYGNNIDDELNQIINMLNGTSTNRRAFIQFSSASQAPLKLNQQGAGDLFVCQKNGVDAFRITNAGQLRSTVPNGTPPIVVTSTTKVTNLNADKCNGIEGAALVRNDTSGQSLLGNLRIKKASTGTYDFQAEVDGDNLAFYRYDGSKDTRDNLFNIANLNSANKLIALDSSIRLQLGYTPTADNDVIRKIDLVSRSTILAIADVTPTTSIAKMTMFVAPKDCVITSIKGFYLSGSPSGNLSATLYKNGATTSQSLTIPSSASYGVVYNQALSPYISLSAGDSCYIVTGTGSGHNDVGITLSGYYV